MNKIFKVIYSKTRHCYVVVSELAKSHCKTTQSHTVKSKTALTAAVLLALGTFSFLGMPGVAYADDPNPNSEDLIGVNQQYIDSNDNNTTKTHDGIWLQKNAKNWNGKGAHGVGAITIGINTEAATNTIAIGERNASVSQNSVYIGAKYDAKNQIYPSSGTNVVSVGYNSDAEGTGSIAIGSGAAADTFDNAGSGKNPDKDNKSIAIGYNANAKQNNIAIGAGSLATVALDSSKTGYLTGSAAPSSYISVGYNNSDTDQLLRRISNVADGAAATDVATVGQLQELSKELGGYKPGFGIEITTDSTDKTKNKISLKRNLGRDADTTDKAELKADADKSALVLGGRVNSGSTSGGQTPEKDYGALGQDSVTVGGADNTVTANGDAAVVVGGLSNKADAQYSTVVGGSANDAAGNESSVFGGFDNDAYGTYATLSGGSMNKAYGDASSVFGGYMNNATGASSVAIGGSNSFVTGLASVGIAGGSTTADNAFAAGNGANVTVNNGTAIGYQATANKEGTVAFGHDAGDANYSASTTWKQKATKEGEKYYDDHHNEITEAQYEALRNADNTFNDYSQPPTYSQSYYNRLVKVADGVDPHDVVVMEQLSKAQNDLKVNAGWGINIEDVTTKDENGKEMTKKNVISLKRNLGKNYGSKYGTGKVNFEADGENSLILGGGALNDSWEDRDKEVTYGAHGKDSILVGGLNNDIAKDSEKVATSIGTKASIGTRAVIIGGTSNTVSYDPVTEKDPDTGKEKVKVDSNGNVIVQTQKTGTDAIIVGGLQNTAKGDGSVLIGGERNEATGLYSTVIGGTSNKTDGWLSSIFGGTKNTITGDPTAAGIFGGTRNTINSNGIAANVFGGENNTADNTLAVVVGGETNTSSGPASIILGGNHNTANQLLATVVGGQLNTATGETSMISGGIGNVTSGAYSYDAGGLYNRVTGMAASSLGGQYSSVNGMYSTGVAGGSTGKDAMLSLAAGYQSVVADSGTKITHLDSDNPKDLTEIENYYKAVEKAEETGDMQSLSGFSGYYVVDPDSDMGHVKLTHYDKFSTALGYQATADEPGTIAFGHDAGDESGYTYEWETLTDENGNPKQNEIDGTTNDYTKAPKSVKKKAPYTSAYYNRLVKVADGIDDHDVVVMEQLKQYAEKDASNIGNNIKVYKTDANGNVQLDKDKKPIEETDATTTAQNGSKDDWGKALGAAPFTAGTTTTATNASISDQLVTGKTLYDYDKPTGSTNYVKVNNTTGQNLSALDAQVKANADALDKPNHNIKYYSVKTAPLTVDGYTNEKNDGAQGKGSIAAGFVTHADGIASTVTGSYSGVINSGTAQGLDLRGAAALSYGTVNVNQNTDSTKAYSGVANSIVGQANMTTNSNAAIIYGAGNIVTDSYRPIDEKKAAAILGSVNDPAKLGETMKDAVKESGGQVMVMGGGNNVESAYMTQVVGVGNTVKGNQVYAKNAKTGKWEWTTDTNKDTAIKGYDKDKSSQYNYVDGFNNEVINGKHDYVIGANNTVTGDSYDDKAAKKYSNESNIIFGDNHIVTNTKNAVIIGSSDPQMTLDKGDNATAIGHNASAQRDALAVGVNTQARGNAVALGTYSTAHNNSIAIGTKATVVSSQNLAIGWEAHVGNIQTDDEKIKNAIALGSDSQVKVNDLLESDNNRGVLSIGDKDKERRIIHVRAGVNDTDAVNVSQLKSAQNDLTDKGLTFAANEGNDYTAKLGSKVTIQGTKKTEGHEYTADNLTTEIDKDGNITILMDKDMSVEKLAVNGKDGKDGQPGSIGIKGQDGKAGIGINGKDGISITGKDGKDGVTMKAVDGKDGTEGHIGLTGPAGTNGKDGTNAVDITVKNGYDGANGINGKNGVDGTSLTRIVYTDKTGEHQVATMEDGMKYAGDNYVAASEGKAEQNIINKKLNNTLDIIGGADSTKLTEKNIGVNDVGGQLKVQLADELSGIKSISNQQTKDGTTTGAKITLGDTGNVDVNGGKITNVGSGADASGNYTDETKDNAANIGDVQAITNSATADLTGKGLKFAANSGDEYTAKLGSTVKIQGTDKKDGHEYTADNLTTEIDKDGNITIKMDKNISAEKLAVNGKDGKNGQPGTAGSIGINGQDGQSGVGIDGKDGISIKGRDGKDGVTIKAVDGKDGTEGHIGLTGPAGTNGKDGTNAVDITVKNGYDGANGINGKNGVDGTSLTRIVYTDKTGEHQVATMEDGLKFKGDDMTVISKKLNNTLDIIGGADSKNLTDKNIGVNSTTDGKLKVQLSKDLTGMNSTTYTTTTGEGDSATTSTTVVNGDGLTITNGPSITNKGVDGGNKVITNVGSGIEKDANGKYTVTDQNKGNAANIGDVQNMVNDAKKDLTDGANGLNSKANIDASNIGANLKGADGSAASAEAQKANAEKWGSAIGTGKIDKDNGQLVTGKTVYEYNKPIAEAGKKLNYVSEDKTTGQNLGALDSQVKTNADNIAKNTESIQNITNNMQNLSDNAVQYDKNSNKSKVTLGGGEGGTTITNVKAGKLSNSSTDAVNGKQLYNEQQAREKADAEINQKVTNNTNEITKIKNGDFTDASKTVIKNLSKDAVQVKAGDDHITVDAKTDETTGNKTYTISAKDGKVASGDTGLISGGTLYNEVHVDKDGSYIKSGNTVGNNLSALDTGLKTTSDLIHTNATGDTIQIGGNSTATKIDVSGTDAKGNTTGRVITGVITDASDRNSAANVDYVEANTQQIYREMNNAYGNLNRNINRAAAGSNALAALHPLDYDPADKASFAVGYGHYRNANAAAIGAFYYPNANTMVNVGVSVGNGDPGINAGVSFKLGQGSAYNGVSKAEMAQTIHDQAAEISTIKANDAAKDKRIDALEKENQEMKKQIQEILARLNG